MNIVKSTRRSTGVYLVCVKVGDLNPHGVVSFTIEGHNEGTYWTLTNQKGAEVLDGKLKYDLMQYLKTRSPERIVELWNESRSFYQVQ